MIVPLLLMAAELRLDCANASTQATMNICAGQEYRKADRALNTAWDAAVAKSKSGPAGSTERLRNAQRKWLAYRDAHCLAQAGPAAQGGSMWSMQQNECLRALTEERTRQLRDVAEPGR